MVYPLHYLLFLSAIVLLELTLMVAALIHLFNHSRYRFGNRSLWFAMVLLLQMIGPVLYFTVGRSEK